VSVGQITPQFIELRDVASPSQPGEMNRSHWYGTASSVT
jgi:hypothetical protein